VSRSVIARYARDHGIETDQVPRRTTVLDEEWLREQYERHQRSTSEIARELGLAQMTVARALERIGVQLRPSGITSHPQMLTTLDRRLPADIRTAVEGTLHGWKRLRRFQIAMTFPTLDETTAYLGLPASGLVTQLQRLEADIGESLFTRSTLARSQAPTPRGGKLLAALERPLAAARMAQAVGQSLEPLPDQAVIDAALERFQQPPKHRGPLKPFDDIPVERIRIMAPTLRLLRDLVEHDDPRFHGEQIVKRTCIDAGTLYPALHRLHDAGWFTSWPEDEQEWFAGAPPGRGPGRRRTYYVLTPDGRRAANYEIEARAIRPKKMQEP
jgi:DNA-binding MarR family transcriptional regulator